MEGHHKIHMVACLSIASNSSGRHRFLSNTEKHYEKEAFALNVTFKISSSVFGKSILSGTGSSPVILKKDFL